MNGFNPYIEAPVEPEEKEEIDLEDYQNYLDNKADEIRDEEG